MPPIRLPRIKTSAKAGAIAIALVGGFEGLRTVAYIDPVGIPTVCFGETRGVNIGDEYSPAQCHEMLGTRLAEFSDGMDKCLKVKVADETYVAFLSFTYNVGTGAFCKSTLARKANAGDITGACNELPKWNKAGGVPWPGLTNRREAERALCLSGVDRGDL